MGSAGGVHGEAGEVGWRALEVGWNIITHLRMLIIVSFRAPFGSWPSPTKYLRVVGAKNCSSPGKDGQQTDGV
eukprot:578874-Prorocentrum_minimum.AAC.1